MDPQLNPYTPGSGLRPLEMSGRQQEIDSFDLLIARTTLGRQNRSLMLTGLRGVGKTVLLNALWSQAERAEWFSIFLEGTPGELGARNIREKLSRELLAASRKLLRRPLSSQLRDALGSVSSFSTGFGVSGVDFKIDPQPGRADTGTLDIDLEEMVEDLCSALKETQSAFVLFIDELQEVDEELLSALLTVQHRAGQREWPFYLVGAGLPNLPARLATARSFAERLFEYHHIGPLEPEAAAQALRKPAQVVGGEFSPAALNHLVTASNGYPYFIQTFGKNIWHAAPQKRFTEEDARLAVELGWRELDAGFFPARWDRATPSERTYLSAMASFSDHHISSTAVTERLGRTPKALSPVRASLIHKGLIYAPEQGVVAFTVPGMPEFIMRQEQIFGEPPSGTP